MVQKRVHAAIAPAVESAVELSKGDDVVNEQGHKEAPPTTSELLVLFRAYVHQHGAVSQQLQAVNDQQAAALQTLSQQLAQAVQLLQAVIGGPAVAASMQQLYTMLQQNVASDQTTAADLLALIQQRALATTVQGLSNRLGSVESALPTLATTQQLSQGLASKLSRAGDTSTGQQIGPNGMTADAYITNNQVALGVKRPIPFAANISTGNTVLDSLSDPLGLGRKALVLKVYLWMITAATVAATVKVGTTPGGSDVLSKTYLLTGLPGLNTLLELAPPPFTVLPAGTTLYVTANSGKWACAVDTLYVSGL